MDDSLVSVVIPCYNAEQYVEDALQSALRQSYQPVEIIAVDDGSTDATLSVLRSFEPDVEVVTGPNRGASAARTKGTERASGAFIQYLDADDRLRSRALDRRVAALRESTADVAYSFYRRLVERDGQFEPGPVERPDLGARHPNPEIAILSGFWVPPVALTYRRDIVDQIGQWHPSLPIIQDARFLQDAAHHGASFVQVPKVLAEYRDHEHGSLSSRDPAAFRHDCLQNAEETERRWRKEREGGLTDEQARHLARVYNRIAENAFWEGDSAFDEAVQGLRRTADGYTRGRLYAGLVSWVGLNPARRMLRPLRALLRRLHS